MPDMPSTIDLILYIVFLLIGGGTGAYGIHRRINGNGGEKTPCREHCDDHQKLVESHSILGKTQAIQEVRVDYLKESFGEIKVKMDEIHRENREDFQRVFSELHAMNGRN